MLTIVSECTMSTSTVVFNMLNLTMHLCLQCAWLGSLLLNAKGDLHVNISLRVAQDNPATWEECDSDTYLYGFD